MVIYAIGTAIASMETDVSCILVHSPVVHTFLMSSAVDAEQ